MGMFDWLGGKGITQSQIRTEMWNLGARHQGEALKGAREELKAGGLSAERAGLLRACVRQLSAS
jgi:hypothetical protein